MNQKKIANLGLFAAVAIIFGYVESLIPFFAGIPGMKLGLANLCLKQKAVDSTGGTIVCLPNKVVIEGEKGSGSDETSPEFDTVV